MSDNDYLEDTFPDEIEETSPETEENASKEEIPEKNVAIKAKEIVNQLKQGKSLHDEFGQELNKRYLISGKLISEWKEHFKVQLPPDPNTSILQSLDSRLLALHQEATFYKAQCSIRLHAAKDRNASLYRDKFTKLVAEYRNKNMKLPAKDTLKALAESGIDDIQSITLHAEIELEFWKEILFDLANCRKLIENATLNISVESKAFQSQMYINAIGKREHH